MDGWRYGNRQCEREKAGDFNARMPRLRPPSHSCLLSTVSLSLSLPYFFVFAPLFSFALPLTSPSRAPLCNPLVSSSCQITYKRSRTKNGNIGSHHGANKRDGPKRRARYPTGLCLWTSVFVLSSLANHTNVLFIVGLSFVTSALTYYKLTRCGISVPVSVVSTQSMASQRSLW